MNTAAVGLAVTPTVLSTFLTHYLNRKPLAHKPTAHLSYNEGLHLIRSFLAHASRHTVEELQAFTSQWVPHPQWVRVEHVEIPSADLARAADLLAEQLGPDGVRQVGGREWWQWRKPKSTVLNAEWIEMRGDYQERKKRTGGGEGREKVMMYVHGGAYYFGSVDEHRYQIQRHARKLKARALAPRYRLAPQFPFPCGLQDCLATYLYLIGQLKPSTVILAGDSAGAGMILSLMVILRDRGIPLPAGAVLISPWVDLTHSFPSVAGDCPMDYIPPSGFHHKPSRAWPPPDEEELEALKKVAVKQKRDIEAQDGKPDEKRDVPTIKDVAESTHRLTFVIDGQQVEIKEQIQMYTTNELLAHPLVSPIMQPTLGGLPPLLIMAGGGELLRDEQIYLAHKCANPEAYLPPERLMDDQAREMVQRYKPTDVQLQVWDDLCHVAPTLSFTRPAKFMYRSVAQFSAWALARAQKTEIDILADDRISIISSSSSSSSEDNDLTPDSPQNPPPLPFQPQPPTATASSSKETSTTSIGRAGSPLPPFTAHMIRQRVTRHGTIFPLPPPSELPGCTMSRDLVGVVKVGTIRKWLDHKTRWDARFKDAKAKVREQRVKEMTKDGGYEVFGGEGEVPPPSALAGRRRRVVEGKEGGEKKEKKRRRKKKGVGLALWGLWGSKHDEATVRREEMVGEGKGVGLGIEVASPEQGQGARAFSDLERQMAAREKPGGAERVRKWQEGVLGGGEGLGLVEGSKEQEGEEGGVDLRSAGPFDDRFFKKEGEEENAPKTSGFLSPDDAVETGVTGKRVVLGGVAMPFSLRKKAETASMITLAPSMDQGSTRPSTAGSGSFVAGPSAEVSGPQGTGEVDGQEKPHGNEDGAEQGVMTPFVTPLLSPASLGERPGLERFVTADEEVKASP